MWFLFPEVNCCTIYANLNKDLSSFINVHEISTIHNRHAVLSNEIQFYIKADPMISQRDWNECWSRVCVYVFVSSTSILSASNFI